MRFLLWRKWFRMLALVLVPACMAAIIVRWAFLLPVYLGVPLEWLVYYPAKLPFLLIAILSKQDITGYSRELVIAAVWAVVSIGIHWWRKLRKDALVTHEENLRKGVRRVKWRNSRLLKLLAWSIAILMSVLVVVAFWAGEGLGIIPSYPGPGLANFSYMTRLSFPVRTRLLFSYFGGGLQDRPVYAELEMDRNQALRLLRSLPSSFRIVRSSHPSISYWSIGGRRSNLSWNDRDGGEGIVAERNGRSVGKYAQLVIITRSSRSSVSEVYIYYML